MDLSVRSDFSPFFSILPFAECFRKPSLSMCPLNMNIFTRQSLHPISAKFTGRYRLNAFCFLPLNVDRSYTPVLGQTKLNDETNGDALSKEDKESRFELARSTRSAPSQQASPPPTPMRLQPYRTENNASRTSTFVNVIEEHLRDLVIPESLDGISTVKPGLAANMIVKSRLGLSDCSTLNCGDRNFASRVLLCAILDRFRSLSVSAFDMIIKITILVQ